MVVSSIFNLLEFLWNYPFLYEVQVPVSIRQDIHTFIIRKVSLRVLHANQMRLPK